MTRPVIARTMSGMFGPVTDPGAYSFTEEIRKAVPGIDLGRSPYRDFEVQEVVNDLIRAPKNAVRLIVGTSLGACNCTVVATYAKAVIIHGMFGFQAFAKWGGLASAAQRAFCSRVLCSRLAGCHHHCGPGDAGVAQGCRQHAHDADPLD